MEATGEESGFLAKIRPPRLEDAGLEDCALPPDAIREAFLKAASIIHHSHDDDDGPECVVDPLPAAGEREDVLIGIMPETEIPGPCSAGKGVALPEDDTGEKVVVVGGDERGADEVVVKPEVPEQGRKGCLEEGLRGLKIDEKGRSDDEEEDGERPVLAEVCI